MRRRFAVLCFLLLPLLTAAPLEDERIQEVQQLVRSERYEPALQLIGELQEEYPDEAAPFTLAADLYASRKLYNLALENYLMAVGNAPGDYNLLLSLAETYGRLDRNRESAEVLESMLKLYPDDRGVVSDLGWMYFKTFQLEKGVVLLEKALDDLDDYGLRMTLGTLHSSLYNFDEAEAYYRESIEMAVESSDNYFASVAHYNLGILYHTFYRYADAMEQTGDSLARRDRPSGHILRGELFQSRMDFDRALSEFSQASENDDTPLSWLNFAYLYHSFGDPERALSYVNQVLNESDVSWMYNYGINRQHFQKDLHQLQSEIYRNLAHSRRRTPAGSLMGVVRRAWAGFSAAVRSRYHDFHFRRLSRIVSDELLSEHNDLDGWWSRYEALRGYGAPAIRYLDRMEAFEREKGLPCDAFYLLERGREANSLPLMLEAASLFDPVWEAELLSETLSLILRKKAGRLTRDEKDSLIRQLFRFNPGGVRCTGQRLPVVLMSSGWSRAEERRLRRYLSSAFSFRRDKAPYRLFVQKEEGGALRFTLAEENGRMILSDSVKAAEDFSLAGQAVQVVNLVYSFR